VGDEGTFGRKQGRNVLVFRNGVKKRKEWLRLFEGPRRLLELLGYVCLCHLGVKINGGVAW
jgi:hypothetical protein